MKIFTQAKDNDGNLIEIVIWDKNPSNEPKTFSKFEKDEKGRFTDKENPNFKAEVEKLAGEGFLEANGL